MAIWKGEKNYDVFLSFRGEDARRGFISHLSAALSSAEIRTFIDDEELRRGEEISESLLKAIELSRWSIVIFSENYANSRWCLDELVKIMECHQTTDHGVLPVFYNVDPSRVRWQRGAFGEAFEGLVRRISATQEKEQRYRKALRQAANLSGWNVANYKDESQFIKAIVKDMSGKIDNRNLFIADYPVGIELRVQEIMSPLQSHTRSNDVLMGKW